MTETETSQKQNKNNVKETLIVRTSYQVEENNLLSGRVVRGSTTQVDVAVGVAWTRTQGVDVAVAWTQTHGVDMDSRGIGFDLDFDLTAFRLA